MSDHIPLRADESELVGHWISKGRRTVGDAVATRIEWLVSERLVLLGTDESGWDELYRDPESGSLWELTRPQSGMHGGGPPRLARIEMEIARHKYGTPAEG